eukprot:GILI01012668.1.p1 GENE.GILI01012668.1~~GILI01012668.1.p1  ORF type:complete len:372 (-),score=32.86 GILI01012668.1:177-1292(-)
MPTISEVTIKVKAEGPSQLPSASIYHDKNFSNATTSTIGDIYARLADLANAPKDHQPVDAWVQEVVSTLSCRTITMFVTFVGQKTVRGRLQRQFETPLVRLPTPSLPQCPQKSILDHLSSFSDSTDSPPIFTASPSLSRTATSDITHPCSLLGSLNIRQHASDDEMDDYPHARPDCLFVNQLPSSLYALNVSKTRSPEDSLPASPRRAGSDPDRSTIDSMVNQYAPLHLTNDPHIRWSATFVFVIGDTEEVRSKRIEDMKCAAVQAVTPPATASQAPANMDHACWQSGRYSANWQPYETPEGLFTLQDYEIEPNQPYDSSLPYYEAAPACLTSVASGVQVNHVFTSYGTPPPVFDIDRLGYSQSMFQVGYP